MKNTNKIQNKQLDYNKNRACKHTDKTQYKLKKIY